ncbi:MULTISPECIES: glutamate-5-semialdehyde dehydrogenase [unclassified Lentimonas]|uniref:glutamate-5-semialdehyde dehydrogenase n=1 Tax=unclassified Lentimonas TaxID=2630993 RepID=UPI001323AD50|nr:MULTISPECIES: glutamate-5-semialdehyde dehydrogenase [unclassified Lentimonas]CAA6678812.1 Gamma-glutamyl phosphate reductase (EC [Lentimonas sp. CC4]CAA6684416.1 Gamma-glutamyl phosphate reductase (EC [Lentimonas sp. CC6]CAA7077505.1 Gamma-glutamyl phosphate reductase (EC [Lentimonas sp. CC4]CAA7171339.1 Gamma-glutamyl phosphate reductase (EC [Lentimonas sp. CC21]CAA7183369.1 Gamma-glutamyl phosphate reductase (EC [Lentimonas sp. CC8]
MITTLIEGIAKRARAASLDLATLSTEAKNRFLEQLATDLVEQTDAIIEANALDLEAAKTNGLSGPMLERLSLTAERIAAMAEGVQQVAALPDPVGAEIERLSPPKGFDLRKIRVPMGVIGIIYESRPNVTVDCAILCLKSGNASILRGGKEAFNSNMKLAEIIRAALKACDINEDAVQVIPTTDRAALNVLLKQDDTIHCIIPRGGESLIRFTVENSRIPVIKHYTGVCSIYIDAAADPEKAESILINAKCQRPSVCNAAENLLVHQDATALLPQLAKALHDNGVELRVEAKAKAILSGTGLPLVDATPEDFATEYTDLIISIAVVADTKDAIELINNNGSGHSDAIITEDADAARLFLAGVDASTVYHNASTRFTDGFEFGLGAEIGISTDRLHARGPMGLNELCTYKYVIHGKGEVR